MLERNQIAKERENEKNTLREYEISINELNQQIMAMKNMEYQDKNLIVDLKQKLEFQMINMQ